MGIQGLLPMFRGSTKDVHVSAYAHKTLAIDGYAWLHRGKWACAIELCQGIATTKHIDFCLKGLQLMVDHNVKPLLVFDGASLLAKRATDDDRREKREKALRKAQKLWREGSQEDARKAFGAAVAVTSEMAAQLCDAAKARWGDRIDFLVAPYEADAQLAQLARSGQCDGVISEDSDNLPYGVPRTVFKYDPKTGKGEQIVLEDLFNAPEGVNAISIRGWTHDMFVLMCCMAGCDYAESVDGVRVKRAHELVGRYRDFDRVLRALRSKYTVPDDYELKLKRAVLTFGHQTVFDRNANSVAHLTPLSPEHVEEYGPWPAFLGEQIGSALAVDIATCERHPTTHVRFQPAALPVQPAAPPAPPVPAATPDDDADFWAWAEELTQRAEDKHEAGLAQLLEGEHEAAAAALAPRKRPRDEDSAGDAPARKRARVAEALQIVGTFAGALAVAWIIVRALVLV